MQELQEIWIAFKLGGIIILPLSLLGIIALAIMLEKAVLYGRFARLSYDLLNLVETYGFAWADLEKILSGLNERHYYKRFFEVVIANRHRPSWWTESRAADEAQLIETSLARRLWVLETIVTAAPLLGLMGTIVGMMHAFQIIGGSGVVNPTGVTGGVAQALIATAVGLLIALIALFGFNYFSRLQSQTMDEMERLGTRLIDHIRLDQQGNTHEAA
ncbi:MAG: MotA/TolQ/ExbB proton channel family protein [Candidatus Nitrotoga sp.]|jgi:biopolymer transport protein ExbB|nr:MotA/TolQ/ExbB proton channel family protein [Candidatus Nitrotoga sp.]RFC30820.1 MAG: outer membrane transport energization protein ExbB [Candidatus Nitrotoga sp. MKT]RFC39923.1 MAG: outer membrane transport energization protein ExbB [Candidatus Nitrotoga sp. CP45]MDO9448637.1 MotA/TolQ/ExbB proton channel family protein [Candidatus Nitrotoga sp.]MDP1637665.1 MotA/TolQ/ExbB proton channel family protein [Candidatus Nitrotoga sp.]